MAFIRNCFFTAVFALCIGTPAKAQTVFYPVQPSKAMKATVEDIAALLQKAVAGSIFNAQPYIQVPANGIVIQYDNSITDNQACKVVCTGSSIITFTAAEDNGIVFGLYEYLRLLGFRFYQPGSIWEITPSLTSAYKKIDTVFTCAYKYKSWYVSGGHNRWAMDNTAEYNWDMYFGENGHSWAQYQRRNGMLGSYRFQGHRGDMMSGDYFKALENNPCYVANFNGSRKATSQSVPDIFNNAATALWANTIEQKFTSYKNTILNNSSLYVDLSRNFSFNNYNIGVEVPDGALWGNSKVSDACNSVTYPKPSDQHFTLANVVADKVLAKYPERRLQLYAYSDHSDVPSSNININKNIDVQIIPGVYQLETSTTGIRNRWYNRHNAVSEYQYLNLSDWSGETPLFNWSDLKSTLQIARDKKSQGVVWEAAPSKFASLPYLLAANANLKDGTEVDKTVEDFCDKMFDAAAPTVYQMLQLWGNSKSTPSKQRMQMYLQLLNTANQQVQNAPQVVKERMLELKAYMHYMVLYFDVAGNDQNKASRAEKDGALCIYLAKINRLQLVNSYYTIATIAARYPSASDFYVKYNPTNGTAYANGTLPLITPAEVENNFKDDIAKYARGIETFTYNTVEEVTGKFKQANVQADKTISLNMEYTYGANYYNKVAFNFVAPAAGKFVIDYTPRFDMPGMGHMNFLVESVDKALQVITDFTITNGNGAGSITVNVPAAGNYMLTISSKYRTAAAITINTNNFYFYKNMLFTNSKAENSFYVPASVNKVYFTVSGHFENGKYTSPERISNCFLIKDQKGTILKPVLANAKDSSLFYIETTAGTFLQITAVAHYNLNFVNISNIFWYAKATEGNTIKNEDIIKQTASLPEAKVTPSMFPNPSNGIFNCMVNDVVTKAELIRVYTLTGNHVALFQNTSQFNIASSPAGMYMYQITVNGVTHKGRVIKQ